MTTNDKPLQAMNQGMSKMSEALHSFVFGKPEPVAPETTFEQIGEEMWEPILAEDERPYE